MTAFSSYDGTSLAYHTAGDGVPLVCLPGGPAQASAYLGTLGGLDAHRTLHRLDLRGSGASAVPDDPATYRCDRLVDDVEAFRAHLGLEQMDLLAHSAGAGLAILYAIRFPVRLRRLVLVTPSLRTIVTKFWVEDYWAIIERMSGEPWYDDAYDALEALDNGEDTDENRYRMAPIFYGRWNETVAEHAAAELKQRSPVAAAGYYAPGLPGPDEVRAGIATIPARALVIAGGRDPAPPPDRAAELAALFPDGQMEVDPEAGHYPWVTDPDRFVETVGAFLDR